MISPLQKNEATNGGTKLVQAPLRPRSVDLFSRALIILSKGTTMITLGLGMCLIGIFLSLSVLSKTTFNFVKWSVGNTEFIEGKIISTVGVDRIFKKWPVYGHMYTFTTTSGELHRGISYSLDDVYKKK